MTPSEVGEELYELGYRIVGDDGEGNYAVRGKDGVMIPLAEAYFRVIANPVASRMLYREKCDRMRKGNAR